VPRGFGGDFFAVDSALGSGTFDALHTLEQK
jgi:hypothetical protein